MLFDVAVEMFVVTNVDDALELCKSVCSFYWWFLCPALDAVKMQGSCRRLFALSPAFTQEIALICVNWSMTCWATEECLETAMGLVTCELKSQMSSNKNPTHWPCSFLFHRLHQFYQLH